MGNLKDGQEKGLGIFCFPPFFIHSEKDLFHTDEFPRGYVTTVFCTYLEVLSISSSFM